MWLNLLQVSLVRAHMIQNKLGRGHFRLGQRDVSQFGFRFRMVQVDLVWISLFYLTFVWISLFRVSLVWISSTSFWSEPF